MKRRALAALIALAAFALLSACAGRGTHGERTVLRFWAMGREGEVLQDLVKEFEQEHPNIEVRVQQIPWSAAHEKLLTAFVGRSTPDIAQLGNTWISEFSMLEAIAPLDAFVAGNGPGAARGDAPDAPAQAGSSSDAARGDGPDRPAQAGSSSAAARGDGAPAAAASTPSLPVDSFFPGIWDTNVIDGVVYGVPWYVDTRVVFYRKDILARAGYDSMPETWNGWIEAMAAVKNLVGKDHFAILAPVNEWTLPVVLGLQAGSTLVKENGTRGNFSAPEFRRAFAFYLDLFRKELAPPVSNNEIANVYQEFARGYFSMYVTGPWNLGEFQSRLPPELKDAWGTSPFPGPQGAASGVSLAGGSSLVLFRGSHHQKEAWQLIEFLSRPEQQVRFYHMTGDLPARKEAWEDTALARDSRMRAFAAQLAHVVPTPKIPEWELIAARLQEEAEVAIRGASPPDSVLAHLDREVDRILAKRRWMLEQKNFARAGEKAERPDADAAGAAGHVAKAAARAHADPGGHASHASKVNR